jgi:cell division protein FtsQ
MPVTVPADRRFLRAQVKPARRRASWRPRLRAAGRIAVVAAAAWLAWGGVRTVASSSLLRVEELQVAGNVRMSRGEVVALVDGLRGRNILAVQLDEWRQRLLECPWVADAALRRSLPATVEITIVERTPLAIGRMGEELYLVDDRGAIIDDWGPRYEDLDLPILDGLGGRSAGPDEDARRAGLAGRLLQDVRRQPDVARRISQVNVSDPHNAVVIVDQDTARVRLGDRDFLARLRAYLEVAPALREQVPRIDYVDLRFGERLYVAALDTGRGGPLGPVAERR